VAGLETGLDIGIAADLRPEVKARAGAPRLLPEDRFEEYDSPSTIEAIAGALAERGHRPRFLGGGRKFVEEILARPPELVFNIAEGAGTRSREAHVPAVCEMLGVPFTGSDPLTLAATLDKAIAKRLVASAGIATARFAVYESAADFGGPDRVGFPCIAKPLREGSSMGIRRSSRVDDAEALREEVERLLADYQEPVLVEEFLPGAEFTVGVLGEGAYAHVLGVMEIEPVGIALEEFVYSLEVKRNFKREVAYHVPPRRPAALVRAVEELALACARALGCRDLARIDVRLGSDGAPRFLEANPLPGLAPGTGDVVILAELAGIPYVELVDRVVRTAVARLGRSSCPAA